METAGTYKLTRAGQVTIPRAIREDMELEEGSILDFYYDDGLIVIRKKRTPLEIFESLAKRTEKRFKDMGLKKEDVPRIIKEIRDEERGS